MLHLEEVTKRFGGLTAVNAVSFDVEEGEILSIIGPNGAGKSTLFKLIGAFLRPSAGRIEFQGEDLTRLPAHLVARRGAVRTFQETTIFREMSALQNVVVARHLHSRATSAGIFFATRQARAEMGRPSVSQKAWPRLAKMPLRWRMGWDSNPYLNTATCNSVSE